MKYFIKEYNKAITELVLDIHDLREYPEEVGAYIVSAKWVDGEPLNEDELVWLNQKYYWLAEELAYGEIAKCL